MQAGISASYTYKMKNTIRYKSRRLKEYDYSYPGAYFITICIDDRKCLFGDVVSGKMILNKLGKIADKCLINIPAHFKNTEIPIHVVMPNHVHAVVNIYESDIAIDNMVGGRYICHLQEEGLPKGIPERRQNQRLPVMIGTYKAAVSREINKLYKDVRFKWQRYYHDHIIGTEKALENIYNYIINNPYNWQVDLENEEYLKTLTGKEREKKAKNFYKGLTGK